MRVKTLEIRWHDNKPVNSCDFQPSPAFLRKPRSGAQAKDAAPLSYRLATAGDDSNVRLWMVHPEFITQGEEGSAKKNPRVEYLSTLSKHSAPVNVVRFSPNGELIASAGDDGCVIFWTPTDRSQTSLHDDDAQYAKEHWRVHKSIMLPDTSIYDLSWSPTGEYLLVGGTDKTVRIISTEGRVLREIAEHNHRVQGVAWDPMNEFLASQSSDRSVHIHSLTIKHGHIDTHAVSKNNKMQVRASRTPSRTRRHGSVVSDAESVAGDDIGDMPPPRSRRSSFSGTSQAGGGGPASRGSSPAPPLPAIRTWTMYNDENANHYFRRLTFSPDGAMLLTPAGQVEDPAVVPGTKSPVTPDGGAATAQGSSSVFVYTRANFTRPPVAQLPGFKKATVAVRFSPVLYELRPHAGAEDQTPAEVTIDKDTDMEVDVDLSGAATASSSVIAPLPSPARETPPTPTVSAPPPVFALPYRMIYAVAAMDSIAVYDTQQAAPIAVLSRLHYDEFTDISWSGDGRVLVLAARDGYCTAVVFDEKVTLHPTQQPALQLQSIAAHSFGGSHAALVQQQQQQQQQTPIMASPSPSVVAPSPAPSHSSLASISQSQSAQGLGSMKRAASPGVDMVPSSSDGMDVVSSSNGNGVPPKKKRRLVLTHHPEQ